MAGLEELAARHTECSPADLERLRLLLADWQLLADLSFSDLVLWLPTWNGSGYVAAAQIRPTTGPTVFADDLVGSFLPKGRRPLVDEAHVRRRVMSSSGTHALVPSETIPVPGVDGGVIAVIARHSDPSVVRAGGRLEASYVDASARLARMICDGTFPYEGGLTDPDAAPRVGDGLVVLDEAGVVTYASPNALSAYRRLGLAADLVGISLAHTTARVAAGRGPVDEDLAVVAGGRAARDVEVEARGAVVLLRAIPLLAAGGRTGALVLVRDVTDIRRRERELLTKDATIREIHHRVKNNLQTVAALLRLQARRAVEPEARVALEEAVHRVGSIAIVHETLSTTPHEEVPFDDIADRLLAMVTEVARSHPEGAGRVVAAREGSFGEVGAEVATPLALVLTELVQNAVEHGFAGTGGRVVVRPERTAESLHVVVEDDGRGLPEHFELATGSSLGLQIARTLLEELHGSLTLGPGEAAGTRAEIGVPL
ncbi:MAG TPA: histidine kinase N-terminal domain-containing protein [Actinomycetes bacterium]|nr:histidine kinase N-terminal domain-containing protein [Actinomycetes bacterium]